MTTKKAPENIKKLLKMHNQSHLLAFWDCSEPARQQNLLAEIGRMDFSKIDDWVETAVARRSPQSTVLGTPYGGRLTADALRQGHGARVTGHERRIAPAQCLSAVSANPQQQCK